MAAFGVPQSAPGVGVAPPLAPARPLGWAGPWPATLASPVACYRLPRVGVSPHPSGFGSAFGSRDHLSTYFLIYRTDWLTIYVDGTDEVDR